MAEGHADDTSMPRTVLNREGIEQRAEALLRDHGLFDLPVDVVRVAQAVGAEIVQGVFPTGEYAGALVWMEDRAVVYVNRFDAPVRKRYTVAHEIGHHELHPRHGFYDPASNYAVLYRKVFNLRGDPREAEANQFAAALLMPKPLMDSAVRQFGPSPEVLGRVFDVSEPAMRIRLKTLGFNPR